MKQQDSLERMRVRKNDHIRICIEENVESHGERDFFSAVTLLPEALPECHLDDVVTTQTFLGRTFSLPILITGMTGGVDRGQEINETLGAAAAAFGIPMGLGSQKMMLKDPSLQRLFTVKKKTPGLFLIGNLGAVSLNEGYGSSAICRLVEACELDAFALHVNALQECVQPEGECNFAGLLRHIEALCASLPVPVLVKEVGSGMTPRTIERLFECGVAAVDVGGSGGTSWSAIEGRRGDASTQRLGDLFRNWGLSTLQSVGLWRSHCTRHPQISASQRGALVATGGVRTGIHVAKALGLGATMAGVGLPLFRAVTSPPPGVTPYEALCSELNFLRDSLRIALFCCGAQSLSGLPERVVVREESFFHGA